MRDGTWGRELRIGNYELRMPRAAGGLLRLAVGLWSVLFLGWMGIPAVAEIPVSKLTLTGSDVRYVVISFRDGTAFDPADRIGLAGLTAELVDAGLRSALERECPDSGAATHLVAGSRRITWFFKAHRDTFDQAFPVFLRSLLAPSVTGETLAAARTARLNARRRTLASAERLSQVLLETAICTLNPEGRPWFGRKTCLEAVTTEEVSLHLQAVHRQGRLELGIAADDPHRLATRVLSSLQDLPQGPDWEEPRYDRQMSQRPRVWLVERPVPSAGIALGFLHDVNPGDTAELPLWVYTAGLGQHRCLTGYLFKELRGLRGFNYGNYAYLTKFVEGRQDKMPEVRLPRQHPYFSIWIRNLAEENAVFALRFALYALQQGFDDVLPEAGYDDIRQFAVNYSRLYSFDPWQRLGTAMDGRYYSTDPLFNRLGGNLAGVTRAEVKQAWSSRLRSGIPVIVIVTADAAAMKSRLLTEADVSPVYRMDPGDVVRSKDRQILEYPFTLQPEDVQLMDAEVLL